MRKGKQMFLTPDGVTLYTEQDMAEARETQRTQFNVGAEFGVRSTTNDLQDKAIKWFRGEVREGNMTQDDATGIYNGLAEALGWDTVNSLTLLFTVVVSYNGMTIAEFEDVEAEDSDSAEDEVRNDLEVEDVEATFTVSYNGNRHTETVNTTYEFDDEFEYQATEQD
jgi:hypothetical protein